MITAVIVDDEPLAREGVKTMLLKFCKDVAVVGMAGSYDEALPLLAETRPNIVFLDIGMPDGSGFDVARDSPSQKTKIVFVSGHVELGWETYHYNAFYFLSKPLRITEMQKVIAMYNETVASETAKQSPASDNIEPREGKPNRIEHLTVTERDGFRLFPYDDIVYFSATGNYCEMHLQGEKPVLISKSVKEIADMLPSPEFLRVHRSYIVHRRFVYKFSRSERHPIELRDGTKIPVSREDFEEIRRKFMDPD